MAILKEEFIKRANTHQTHFEDLIMLGEGGIEEFNDKIEKFMSGDSEMNYTTKIDGSPALFIWSKFPGYPDNSICLKSFVANANNCMSSVEEIDSKYGDRPDMAEKLKYGLEIAKSIPENECWQGDCLFGANDKKVENIRGKEYVTFHPNKIVYAFSEENASFEKVVNSSFGIAFHTIYRPNGDGGKSQSFRVDASRLKNLPNDIFVLSPTLNYNQDQFDKSKLETLYENLRELEDELLSDDAYHGITSNDAFMAYWNTFENANIADKRKTTLDIRTFFNDLWEYIDEKQTKEWTKRNLSLKTIKSRSAAYDKWVDSVQEMHEFLKHNKDTLVKMVQAFNLAADIKMELWNGFKGTKNDYSTFYKSRTKGILDADMEGIAMSDADGNIVKIVDRSEFSANNRDNDIMSGWEHPNDKINEATAKTVVCAFGRMNPPTIGHRKLVDTMAELAKPTRRKARLYLSHSHDNNKNPLDFDTKLRFCKEAFEPQIKVMNSGAKTIIHIFHELYEEGFENVIYVGGEDRIGGEEDMTKIISKYNGYGTEKLPLYYKFDSIQFENAGHRDDSSDSEVERASGSLARRLAADGKWRLFKRIMPFEEDTARELYDILRGRLRENLFESILRILHEDIDNISNIKNAIKNYIKSKVEEPLEVAESNRHKKEICRIKATSLDYDENFVLDTLKDILDNGYCEIPYKKDKIKIKTDFELVEGTSKAYYSICLKVTYNGQKDELYITDLTHSLKGTKSKGKKLFVPNNVLNPEILGQYSSLDEIIENINFKSDTKVDMFLKELAKAAKTATTTDLDIVKYLTSTASERSDISSNTIELSFNSTPKLDKIIETIGQDNIAEYSNSIGVDFGEVFGSIALASVLEKYGNNNPEMAIMFPPESNYPLVDYFIKPLDETQEYKISAKAGAGGQATIGDSCKVISTMVDREWGPKKKHLKERYANSISFVRWFTEISKKSVHESFKAIAQSLLGTLGLGPYEQLSLDFLSPEIMATLSGQIENINKIYKIKPSYSNLGKMCEITNAVIDSFNLPRTSIMSTTNIWTEKVINEIQAPNQLEIYFNSLKIKCLCKILINVLNNSDIISGFNDLFNMSFGTFIQIYFKQVLIEKGTNYKFNAVIKSVTGEDSFGKDSFYELSMDCSLDGKTGQFKMKRLAMKLRH